ncbi:MAG: nicotinate-nucleotide adenylyltransferase [Pseudomonadota bacterium]
MISATVFTGVSPEYLRMPYVEKGMTIGLFGGSFNPPHEGHLLVSEIALRRLGLQQLWWMVTPGNPLKDISALPSLAQRIQWSEDINNDGRVKITAFEAAYKVRYTAETLAIIRRRNPGVKFIWIMGADNLANFHKWQDWQKIAQTFPIAVIDRPGSTLSYLSSMMAKTFDYARIDETDGHTLGSLKPPAWTFIHGPRSPHSSTAIRDRRKQGISEP